jgi:hypothetical protein
MSMADLTANLTAMIDWAASRANGDDFANSVYADRLRDIQSLTFGTASSMVDNIYVATRTVHLATLTDNLDLSGSLLNPFGEVINFSRIKGIMIVNRSEVLNDNLVVGNSGASAWVAPFRASSTEGDTIHCGGVWLRTAPLDGYLVTAGTRDNLRITHAGVSSDITYDIVIIGIG